MPNNPRELVSGTLRILKSNKCDGAPVIFHSPPHARKPISATGFNTRKNVKNESKCGIYLNYNIRLNSTLKVYAQVGACMYIRLTSFELGAFTLNWVKVMFRVGKNTCNQIVRI